MVDLQKVSVAIDNLVKALTDLKTLLPKDQATESALFKTQSITPTTANVDTEDFESFEALKKALYSDKWPEAVNPHLICGTDSYADKMERANGILDFVLETPIKDKAFLDLGCGEGYITLAALVHQPTKAIGYDRVAHPDWSQLKKDKLDFTTSWETVVANGPYDFILLYDVIDHLVGEEPVSILRKAKSVLADNGKIFMRCHPFTSRHAIHLYHDLNKAYVHLVFTPKELEQLVPNPKYITPNNGVVYPLKTYDDYLKEVGLRVEARREVPEPVEPFFKIPKIAARIMASTRMMDFPEFQMSLQFVDYALAKQ